MRTTTEVLFDLTDEDMNYLCVSDYENGRGAVHLRRDDGRFVISASLDGLEKIADLVLKKIALFRRLAEVKKEAMARPIVPAYIVIRPGEDA